MIYVQNVPTSFHLLTIQTYECYVAKILWHQIAGQC